MRRSRDDVLRQQAVAVAQSQCVLKSSRASSRRPSATSASISQKRQIRNAVPAGRNRHPPRSASHAGRARSSRSIASTVETKRGSSLASIMPSSGSNKHAGVEIVDAERRGEGAASRFQARLEQLVADRVGEVVPEWRRGRAARDGAAIAASRWHPAQHIAAEWVCTRLRCRGIPRCRHRARAPGWRLAAPAFPSRRNRLSSPGLRQPPVEEHRQSRPG